jgi:hypothetical protein
MTKPYLGLTSGIQDSTYQRNRDEQIEQLKEKIKKAEEEFSKLEADVIKLRGY